METDLIFKVTNINKHIMFMSQVLAKMESFQLSENEGVV